MVEAEVTVAGVVVAVAGIIAWGIYSLFSSGSSENKKLMKAPGGNGKIFRDDFEGDPKAQKMVDKPNGDGSFSKNGTEIEEKKSTKEMVEAVTVAGAVVAVAGIVAWGVSSLFSSGSSESDNRKLMKAPGGNGKTIIRDDFEDDPKAYFKKLRKP